VRSTARTARPLLAGALALVVCALAACSTPAHPMPDGTLDKLRPGLTTKADVQALLGAPGETEALPDGNEAWLYTYTPVPLHTAPDPPPPSEHIPRYDVLRLVFRPDGLLAARDVTHMVAPAQRGGVPALKALGTP
jgi:outer membrane protein assembly factor BamE (lipoprotein component of BamABCDE complex)